jgi:hypothetical protein
MPLLLLFIVFHTDSYIQLSIPLKLQGLIYLLVFISTFLMPVFASFLLVKNGIVKSVQMETKEERRLPFLITATFYFLTFYLLRQVRISSLIYFLFLGASLTLMITLFINFRFKISAHMVGIGGVIGALIGMSIRLYIDYRMLIMLLLLVAGLIGSARIVLKAHDPAQIYAGFMVGVLSELSLFLLL